MRIDVKRQNKIQESRAMVPMTTKVNGAKELKSLEPGSKLVSIGTRRGEGMKERLTIRRVHAE
ncbi:hypothetical protein H5410_043878 [Solanum commersonii]|uniref:Uncharacterized protein n=1 Tax=Solanum commersonii TaxID=4109 RepID=A0A9J5Y230_SOLCO|nr:hypothetical protein H5410_043878 [Solanum commersonii]